MEAVKIGELKMLKYHLAAAVIVSSLAIGLADTASAVRKAKKLSYKEAWAACQKHVQVIPEGSARYSRGAACMKQHKYRL